MRRRPEEISDIIERAMAMRKRGIGNVDIAEELGIPLPRVSLYAAGNRGSRMAEIVFSRMKMRYEKRLIESLPDIPFAGYPLYSIYCKNVVRMRLLEKGVSTVDALNTFEDVLRYSLDEIRASYLFPLIYVHYKNGIYILSPRTTVAKAFLGAYAKTVLSRELEKGLDL